MTTSSLQQLFVMNSGFMRLGAQAVVKNSEQLPDDTARVQELYRRIFGRTPTPKELDMALSYLNGGTLEQYAHILLSSNELIFWP